MCVIINTPTSASVLVLPQLQREFEDCVRAYCHPGRVACVWADVLQRQPVRTQLYPALVSLWDQCGVLISRQRADLRKSLAAFKKQAKILEHLVDISDFGLKSACILPLAAERNTPFITCQRLTDALNISDRVEWPALVAQLDDSGDLIILQRSHGGQLGWLLN